jgi:polyhydroxybutyrate depolymerase
VSVWNWYEPTMKPVIVFAIEGGGHVVPNPHFKFPAMLGPVTGDIDAPQAIWKFFASVLR